MTKLRRASALKERIATVVRNRNGRTDTIEVLPTEKKTLEFSYVDRGTYAFMDPESFETIELPETLIGDSKNYLTANGKLLDENKFKALDGNIQFNNSSKSTVNVDHIYLLRLWM